MKKATMMTTEMINKLNIGDELQIYVRDIFGNGTWVDAVVTKISEPSIEDADEFGIYFRNVYAKVNVDGEEYNMLVSPGMSRVIK